MLSEVVPTSTCLSRITPSITPLKSYIVYASKLELITMFWYENIVAQKYSKGLFLKTHNCVKA